MILHRLHNFFRKAADLCGGAEGAVVHVSPGPAGNLTDFRRAQPTRLATVKLAGFSERHVVQVHIQAHPDCVSRYEIIDLSGLIHLNLSIPRTRAQRP